MIRSKVFLDGRSGYLYRYVSNIENKGDHWQGTIDINEQSVPLFAVAMYGPYMDKEQYEIYKKISMYHEGIKACGNIV